MLIILSLVLSLGLLTVYFNQCRCFGRAKSYAENHFIVKPSALSISLLGTYSISIRGQVKDSCHNGALSNLAIKLDNEYTAMTDVNGWYEFPANQLVSLTGIPEGNHFLVATAKGFRSKIIRFIIASQGNGNQQAEVRKTPIVINFTLSSMTTSDCPKAQGEANNALDAVDTVGKVSDEDQDGVDDLTEDWLAQKYAPIVYHSQCERNYPVSVDWFLAHTSLNEYDDQEKKPFRRIAATQLKNQAELLNKAFLQGTGDRAKISSSGTRSFCKRGSYFLANVQAQDQLGSRDHPGNWITYVHSYPNQQGGLTIQYWRCYSYNDASFLGFDFSHGGDWEGIAVHLDGNLKPATVAFLGHTSIEYYLNEVQWEGDHPKVWSEEGGHSSHPNSKALKSSQFTRQESWTGGKVIWWDGKPLGVSGGILNIGEKSHPRNGQLFVQYSGLWGTPAKLFITSGYWGPAFNETDARCDNGQRVYGSKPTCSADPAHCGRVYHKAWCDGMNEKLLNIDVECYANSHFP